MSYVPNEPGEPIPRTSIAVASTSPEAAETFERDIQAFFPGTKVGIVIQLSQEPPAWIEIMSEVLAWQTVFKVAAGAYIARLATHVADKHWEERAKVVPAVVKTLGAAFKPVRDLFQYIRKVKESLPETQSFSVRVGIPGPKVTYTAIVLRAESEEEFADTFCLFIHHMEAIQNAVKVMGLPNTEVGTMVWCRFCKNGFTLDWSDFFYGKPLVQEFDWAGTPLGEPRLL